MMLSINNLSTTGQHKNNVKYVNKLVEMLKKTGLHDEGMRVCLAGGAIRDTVLGYTPNDYDLFFYHIDPTM